MKQLVEHMEDNLDAQKLNVTVYVFANSKLDLCQFFDEKSQLNMNVKGDANMVFVSIPFSLRNFGGF